MDEPTFDVEKSKSVVYVDGLGREHEALVTAVNGLHPGLVTLVFVDVNAPEPDNVKKIFDVAHMSQITEPNPDLPNYQVNCWKEFYENHQALPADHPGFDHPAKAPEYDEQGNRVLPERPLTVADIREHLKGSMEEQALPVQSRTPDYPELRKQLNDYESTFYGPHSCSCPTFSATQCQVIRRALEQGGEMYAEVTNVVPTRYELHVCTKEVPPQTSAPVEPDVTQMLDAAPPAPTEPAPPAEEGSTE